MKKINSKNTLKEVINHPAFIGYGNYLFPKLSILKEEMSISEAISSLIGNTADVEDITKTFNEMIRRVEEDTLSFYPIYTEAEIKEDNRKKDVGIFFFKGNKDAPFSIISAGGAFTHVVSMHEGFPYAIEQNKEGFNAFVLNYRTGGGAELACEDLARAIEYVFENKDKFEIDTDNYSLWGSSAGARMAAYLGSYGTLKYGKIDLPKPKAVIMAYTAHRDYSDMEPATFVVVGENDSIVDYRVMKERINALKALGVDTEYYQYPNLPHGFGLAKNTLAEGWVSNAISFWKKQID